MSADAEPDVAGLFAPVDIVQAVGGLLDEARAALAHIDDPVDAELWGSDVIGALASAGQAAAMTALAEGLIPVAEQAATPEALAVLRVFGAIGSPDLREAAAAAAGRVAAQEVADASWATEIGAPKAGDCWHYADVGGRHESLTMTFTYGNRQHAVSVLIDHGRGGKIKDVWVAKGSDRLFATELAVGSDPLVVFEMLSAAEARGRLAEALITGECPEQPDQADDIAGHRALLHARVGQLPKMGEAPSA